jgi:serine/threonine-protein kinase RsbW
LVNPTPGDRTRLDSADSLPSPAAKTPQRTRMASTGAGRDEPRADVELRLPAERAYVSVLRTTSAGLAARLDFTIDDIEDLRIAVGEASALVLPEADAGSDLTCEFFMDSGDLTIRVSVPAAHPTPLDEDSFAWQVLTTLAATATVTTEGQRFAITLRMQSALQVRTG